MQKLHDVNAKLFHAEKQNEFYVSIEYLNF